MFLWHQRKSECTQGLHVFFLSFCCQTTSACEKQTKGETTKLTNVTQTSNLFSPFSLTHSLARPPDNDNKHFCFYCASVGKCFLHVGLFPTSSIINRLALVRRVWMIRRGNSHSNNKSVRCNGVTNKISVSREVRISVVRGCEGFRIIQGCKWGFELSLTFDDVAKCRGYDSWCCLMCDVGICNEMTLLM